MRMYAFFELKIGDLSTKQRKIKQESMRMYAKIQMIRQISQIQQLIWDQNKMKVSA